MTWNKPVDLVKTFMDEHRTFMRGLSAVLEQVKRDDLMAARNLADELDQMAGPHIQFEEEILYPEVGRARGQGLERQLRDEHSVIRNAIERLLDVDFAKADLPKLRAELEVALKTAVQHAESCGTLISHLKTLSPVNQQEAIRRLCELRDIGTRWTELYDKTNTKT